MNDDYVLNVLNQVNYSNQEEIDKAVDILSSVSDDLVPNLIVIKSEIAAKAIVRIGYPRVQNVLAELLVWLQDMNWPGSYQIAELFVSIGKPAILYIKEVLTSNDDVWKYWVMEYVISKWSKDLVEELKEELISVMCQSDIFEFTDIIAMRILGQNGVNIRHIFNSKKNGLEEYIERLNELEEIIKD
ncbi:DUF5071 domain-containing protein [Desulfosporosinus sp. OT]|uniref:DUF5071 domain-containing protein n=1 Tax=Desulfosporosinus sp. OT TaxID=913865 RepID=UPI001300C955|nr:DUF5071 domain-containing protein [Desulfosporosinus sp. OT]